MACNRHNSGAVDMPTDHLWTVAIVAQLQSIYPYRLSWCLRLVVGGMASTSQSVAALLKDVGLSDGIVDHMGAPGISTTNLFATWVKSIDHVEKCDHVR